MKKFLGLLAISALLVAFVAPVTFADSLPSSKWAAAIGQLTALGTASAVTPGTPSDTGWITVARTFIKMPNQQDIAMDMALQCGIVTDTTVKSKGGTVDTSQAQGTIRVRVKVTDEAGNVRYAGPNESDDPELGVTYCDRLQRLEAQFAGLNCTADLTTGAVTCTDPESLRLLLKTLNANAFNFLLADAVPGVHKIEVEARAQASVQLGGSSLGEAKAEAFVGLGSLLVEKIRLIKGADGTPTLQ